MNPEELSSFNLFTSELPGYYIVLLSTSLQFKLVKVILSLFIPIHIIVLQLYIHLMHAKFLQKVLSVLFGIVKLYVYVWITGLPIDMLLGEGRGL